MRKKIQDGPGKMTAKKPRPVSKQKPSLQPMKKKRKNNLPIAVPDIIIKGGLFENKALDVYMELHGIDASKNIVDFTLSKTNLGGKDRVEIMAVMPKHKALSPPPNNRWGSYGVLRYIETLQKKDREDFRAIHGDRTRNEGRNVNQ